VADDEHLERVRLLREQGRSPKEIARILGIRPAEASRLVRAAAVLAQAAVPEQALVGCWISPAGVPAWTLAIVRTGRGTTIRPGEAKA